MLVVFSKTQKKIKQLLKFNYYLQLFLKKLNVRTQT